MSPVYRNSAGIQAVRNKKPSRIATKTTSANPSEKPLISRHNKGTNVSHNMNTKKINISDTKRQCMNFSYYQCSQSNDCNWKWIIENKKGYCG